MRNATDTNACDMSVFNSLCQMETITTQLNDSPMLNTLKWKQAFTTSFQSHSLAAGLPLSSTAWLNHYSSLAFW